MSVSDISSQKKCHLKWSFSTSNRHSHNTPNSNITLAMSLHRYQAQKKRHGASYLAETKQDERRRVNIERYLE